MPRSKLTLKPLLPQMRFTRAVFSFEAVSVFEKVIIVGTTRTNRLPRSVSRAAQDNSSWRSILCAAMLPCFSWYMATLVLPWNSGLKFSTKTLTLKRNGNVLLVAVVPAAPDTAQHLVDRMIVQALQGIAGHGLDLGYLFTAQPDLVKLEIGVGPFHDDLPVDRLAFVILPDTWIRDIDRIIKNALKPGAQTLRGHIAWDQPRSFLGLH